MKKRISVVAILLSAMTTWSATAQNSTNYKIVDTGQSKYFDNTEEMDAPQAGEPFYGQDAQYIGNIASYTDNGDGTITDNVTGLVWQKEYKVMSYAEAMKAAKKLKLGGYNDWRVPTIKEAYSLILFSGSDVNPNLSAGSDTPGTPFIDTNYFDFSYGANGNRAIDSQLLTSTIYVGSIDKEKLVFGVNFADGRIKGYGMQFGRQDKPFMVRFVRGEAYGINDFADNGDGTISDRATSLMWSKEDSQQAMNWEEALAYAAAMNAQNYLGYSDWKVPNAKELQSIVDYTRSPLTTSSAAIDPLFNVSTIVDESGTEDYPFYWTSTTHENSGTTQGGAGIYVAFGRSIGNLSNSTGGAPSGGEGQRPPQGMGNGGNERRRPEGDMMQHNSQQRPPQGGGMQGMHEGATDRGGKNSEPNWIDVHGAGSQRSDPKAGDNSIYANGHGPQGDAVRIYNYVRLVRDL